MSETSEMVKHLVFQFVEEESKKMESAREKIKKLVQKFEQI